MKKWWISAAVAVVIIAFALPLSAGLFVGHYYTTEKLYDALLPDQLKANFSADNSPLKVVSFERGLFGAKGVIALSTGYGYGEPEWVIEQEFRYGWFLNDQFPYLAIVKTNDTLRVTFDEAKDILKDGILLSGTSTILPYISASAHYSSEAIRSEVQDIILDPITIDASYSAAASSASLRVNVPLLDMPDLYIEGFRIVSDGAYPLQTVRAESYSTVTLKWLKVREFELNDLSIIATDTLKPNALDTRVAITAASFKAEDLFVANNIRFNFDIIDQDFQTLEQLVEAAQNVDNSNPFGAINTLTPLLIQLSDKGAYVAINGAYNLNTYPSDFNIKIATDPTASFDLNFMPSIAQKFIVDLTATSDLRIMQAFGNDYQTENIKQLIAGGYIQEVSPNVVKATFQLKNGRTTLGGKSFPQ